MPFKKQNPRIIETKTKEDQRPTLPRNWPQDILYLYDHTYSSAVTSDQKAILSRTTPEHVSYAKIPPEALRPPYPHIEIRIIKNEKHPAHGQCGLFAGGDLEADSFICLYLGHVHTNALADTDPCSDYDLSYDREAGLSVDAAHSGNEARFAVSLALNQCGHI